MSSDDTNDDSATSASDETKRKFREALERKKQQAGNRGQAHLDGGSSVGQTHGPAQRSREFRRKSG